MGSASSLFQEDTPDETDISKSKNDAVVGNKAGARSSRATTKFPQKQKRMQPKVNIWDHLQILPLHYHHHV